MSETNDTIVLIDEDNVEHEFRVDNFIDLEDKRYAVLIPYLESGVESEELVILRFSKNDAGEELLVDIEDDDEWDRVCEAYDALLDEEEGYEF